MIPASSSAQDTAAHLLRIQTAKSMLQRWTEKSQFSWSFKCKL